MPPFQLDVVSQKVRRTLERWTKRKTKLSPIHLPVELWIEIGSYLRYEDRKSLSMVARIFRGLFQESISSVATIPYPHDTYKVLKHLLDTPILHPFIRDLRFNLDIGHRDPKASDLKTQQVTQNLFYKRVFTSIFPNLHTLHLRNQSLSPSQASSLLECQTLRNLYLQHVVIPLPLRQIPNSFSIHHLDLSGRTIVNDNILDVVARNLVSFEYSLMSTRDTLRRQFPVLKTFVIYARQSFQYSWREFQDFFYNHPTITNLDFNYIWCPRPFEPYILPNLKTLSGDNQSVELVVHGSRHIQYLKVTSPPYCITLDDLKTPPRIPYDYIEILEWILECTCTLQLKLLPRFTRLQELRTRLDCAHICSSECPILHGPMFKATMPKLEKLIFITTSFSFAAQAAETIQSYYLSSNFPSLKFVQFQRAIPLQDNGRDRIEVESTWMVPRS